MHAHQPDGYVNAILILRLNPRGKWLKVTNTFIFINLFCSIRIRLTSEYFQGWGERCLQCFLPKIAGFHWAPLLEWGESDSTAASVLKFFGPSHALPSVKLFIQSFFTLSTQRFIKIIQISPSKGSTYCGSRIHVAVWPLPFREATFIWLLPLLQSLWLPIFHLNLVQPTEDGCRLSPE